LNKKVMFALMAALLMLVSQFQTAAATPVTLPWAQGWDSSLPIGLGSKLTYNAIVSQHVLIIVYVLNGASINTAYQVGVHNQTAASACPVSQGPGPTFGFHGLTGWTGAPSAACGIGPICRQSFCTPATSGLDAIELGVLTTDATGSGSFVSIQREIIPGTYLLKFDVREDTHGVGCVPPSLSYCGVVLQTPPPNFGAFQSITV